jgi:hypothetical protein
VRAWWRDVSLELQFLRGFINVLPSYNRSHYNTALVFQVGYRLIK